jgi:RNA-binding protein NOB1
MLMELVIAFAKKTGDYAVLSSTDLGVIALTLQYEIKENGSEGLRLEPGSKGKGPTVTKLQQPQPVSAGQESAGQTGEGDVKVPEAEAENEDVQAVEDEAGDEEVGQEPEVEEEEQEEEQSSGNTLPAGNTTPEQSSSAVQMNVLTLSSPPSTSSSLTQSKPTPSAEEEDSDSDAGEWITPSNVSTHRSRDLGHLPEGGKSSLKEISAACMTGDFAVQNVLLAMALGLVGEGGKRIGKVKSWVLRCHACFK